MEHNPQPLPNQLDTVPDQDSQVLPGKTVISTKFLQFFAAFFGLLVILGIAVSYFKSRLDAVPKDYDECVQRPGSRLQKTVPPSCITLEGHYFIESSSATNEPVACKRSGCSGQFCVDLNAPDQISTCEYSPVYSCYQEAPCERQPDGQCDFTPSAALSACIEEKKNSGGLGIQ